MPFKASNPPEDKIPGLKKLTDAQKRQWVHVFNSSASSGDNETTAIKKAWGAVNNSKEAEVLEEVGKTANAFSLSSVTNPGSSRYLLPIVPPHFSKPQAKSYCSEPM